MKPLWLPTLLFLLPASLEAAVYFTEIAWMGSTESPNQEWIELYNDGGAVNVDGWQIADANNLSIDLTGTIPANSYVVLERSSDDSAPGSAFLIYTGSLVNTGATLSLLRADGSVEDQVSGGEDWQNIGGDNSTKETAQYTSSGWTTAEPTPGAGLSARSTSQTSSTDNTTESTSPTTSNTSNQSSTASRSSSSNRPSLQLELPDVSLDLFIDAPEVGYVNQPIKFTADASGIGDMLINSLSYDWNFGTGDINKTENPEYIFKHPGKYVVTLFASYKRQEHMTTHEITILPVALSLGTNREGDLLVHNESKYRVDLSNYRLRGDELFVFPPRTYLLPDQTIVIDSGRVGSSQDKLVAIYDGEGAVVDMLTPGNLLAEKTPVEVIDRSPTPMISATAINSAPVPDRSDQRFGFGASDTDVSVSKEAVATDTSYALTASDISQSAAVANSQTPVEAKWPYLALIGLMSVAIIGVVTTKVTK